MTVYMTVYCNGFDAFIHWIFVCCINDIEACCNTSCCVM